MNKEEIIKLIIRSKKTEKLKLFNIFHTLRITCEPSSVSTLISITVGKTAKDEVKKDKVENF